ncbi:FecCD family ABC transporter permease [Alteromonas mediterranea]|uniref:Iron ABC transporter n=1 Tax=Alteromonas mediterranea TaxID=314275 RepID=A0AAC8XLG0_9ALTE|nr:iron ABC transporter permease [Alteromonas mediterranea]AFV86747.1 hemin ABC transporter pemease component [Alteromonas mediterranea DE1]AGP98760.1 hemin ABC transporter pemease component [Alteromonas mediterranea UM7]AGQ02961.1 hemin ABC transporter pemease component [Alteromonas mediterranea UM4b]AMJ79693.1 iron ABC transporter [Alteromonas mediterranea]AMJ83851.1 iron ABC transporter [Alteromonas mediterranea]
MQLSSAAKHSDNPSDYPSGNLGDNPSDYSSVPVVLQLINARAQRKRIGMGILLLLLLTCAYVGLTRGSLPIDIEQQLRYFISGANTVENTSANTTHWYVLSEIRLPRVIMTMLIGALLAVSGCAMQGLVRNPLADPGLIGIAGGAAAAAALSMTIVPPLLPALESVWVAMWAFGGALLSVWTVLRFSNGPQGVSVAALILAGVAINALTGTVIGAISYVASDDALRQISYWTMGSLAGASWTLCGLVALASFIAITGLMKSRNALNLMALGEKEAAYMGLNVTRYKQRVLWLVAFSVALATALCGIIGFVGLVVPHMCRAIFGVNHQVLIPASALTGALLLIVADTLARTLFVPMEIPIGIVTSAVGAPFFLYLLWQQRRIFSGGV